MDTFRNGGILVDTTKWYAGRDKVQHVLCALLATRALLHWTPLSWWWVAIIVTLGGCVIETIEDVRYQFWVLEGGNEQPPFCDRASWRDLVANTGGILLGLTVF